MTVERQENKPRAYQRFPPGEFRKEDSRKRSREIMIGARKRLAELQETLEKAEFPKPFLGLREAAEFLREISPDNYPSVATAEKIIKIAVILGDFPLPPEAVRVTSGKEWRCRLTKTSLLTVFDVTLEILETRDLPLEKAWQQAKKTFQEEREKRIPVENLFPGVFQQLGYTEETSERRKIRAEKSLLEKLQAGKLPLPFDVLSQEILIYGVLMEDQDDFVGLWTESVREEMGVRRKALAPRTRLALGREEKSVHLLGSGFQEIFGLKRRGVYTKDAAFYLQKVLAPYGVEIVITRHKNGVSYDCFVEEEGWKKLTRLKGKEELEPVFAKAQAILENGFQTLEDYQEYCPPGFLLSLREALRLLNVPHGSRVVAAKIEEIKWLLGDKLQVVEFDLNPKTGNQRKAYYLSLDVLEELMAPSNSKARLKLTETLGETLPSVLYRQGELLSLSSLLREAGFGKVPPQKVGGVYEFLRDKLKIYYYLYKGYQLLKRDKEVNLKVVKDNWQEIERLLT